jgi:surface polysaccharide O-acyltransferase-like enzyme
MATVVEIPDMRSSHRQPAQANATRLSWLDFARLLAAYSIVWLHTPHSPQLAPWNVLGRFAVPFFTASAVFFVIDGLRRQPRRTLAEYTINRFRRNYLPFVAWSFVYLVVKLFKKTALPEQANDFHGIEVLWTGTFWHLWFMPFVLLVTLCAFSVGRPLLNSIKLEWAACATAIFLGMALACVAPPAWVAADENFLLLAWLALPSACWGFALALAYPHGLKKIVAHPAASLIALAGFAALIAWMVSSGRNDLVENLSGTLFLIAALQPKSPACVARAGRFGAVAFGIYLAHPLIIKTCEALATKLHWPISWQLDLSVFAIAAIGSTLLAWALTKSRYTRWLAA